MKKTLFLLFVLLLMPFVNAWDYNPHLIINESLQPNQSVFYKDVILVKINDSYYSSDNVSLFLDLPNNKGCSFSFDWENITYPYSVLKGFFKSNFSKPDFFNITVQNQTFTYYLLNNTLIILPLNLTNQTSVEVRVDFGNVSYYYEVPIVDTQKPKVKVVSSPKNLIINEQDSFLLLVDDDYFIKNISVYSLVSNKTFVKWVLKDNLLKVFVRTRLNSGIEKVKVVVTDLFDNDEEVVLESSVIPKDNVFFRDVNIPLWKVGEESSVLLYKGDSLNFNITLISEDFKVSNFSKNLSNKKYYSVWLETPISKYSLLKNNTLSINTNELKLGFVGLDRGNLSLVFKIVTPEEIVSNDYFRVKINFGDFKIVPNQTINIGGRSITCFLRKKERLDDSKWVCKSEFPLRTNLEEEVMVLLRRDYNLLLDNFNYQIQEKNLLIKKYKLYFIFFMITTIIFIIYFILKKFSLGFIKT